MIRITARTHPGRPARFRAFGILRALAALVLNAWSLVSAGPLVLAQGVPVEGMVAPLSPGSVRVKTDATVRQVASQMLDIASDQDGMTWHSTNLSTVDDAVSLVPSELDSLYAFVGMAPVYREDGHSRRVPEGDAMAADRTAPVAPLPTLVPRQLSSRSNSSRPKTEFIQATPRRVAALAAHSSCRWGRGT